MGGQAWLWPGLGHGQLEDFEAKAAPGQAKAGLLGEPGGTSLSPSNQLI